MRWIAFAILAGLVLASCAQRAAWTLPVEPARREYLLSAAPAGRLPGVARPLVYRAHLDIDPRQSRFSGTVEIDVELEAASTGLWLHGDDLDVLSATATAGGETVVATWTEVLESGVVWIGFPKRLESRRVTLAIAYEAAFNPSLAGLFKVEAQGAAYALAKSESTEARRFLPSFDEPGLKAVFAISITVPEGMQAIANTPEVSRTPARPGHETIRFAPTGPLSTYLLSTAVGDFDRIDRAPLLPNRVRTFAVPLTGYTRAGKAAELDFALDLTPPMMQAFEEMLGQPYPYEKLDIIASPQWPSGATELAAAITYRESRILAGPNAGPGLIRALKEIHAHEIAHMWFGNLVTPPWWDDLWLKEAFATWSETAILEIMEPDGRHGVAAVADGLSAMALDGLASARAVAAPIGRNEDIRNAYDALTYSKGQSVIRMVDHYLTPERFRPALGRYIARYADDKAASDDFYLEISRATGDAAVGEIFRSFMSQPGVPTVDARLQCTPDGPRLTLRQSRYRPLGSAINPDALWTFPVCTAWQDGANRGETCVLLDRAEKTVRISGAVCPSVLVPNANGTGYYRFSLSPETWRELGRALARLPAEEALVSLDSAEAAFAAGQLDAETSMELHAAALLHTDAAVLSGGLRGFETLLRHLDDHPQADRIRSDVARILDARPAMVDPEAANRILGFRAITLEQPATRAELRRRVSALADGTGALSSDLYVPALKVSFADGGPQAFAAILAARDRLDDAVFTQAVADAIGAVTDPALARQAEKLMFDSAYGGAASQAIALSLLGNPLHREATWREIKARFPDYLRAIPAQSRRGAPRLARAFCDPQRSAELTALFAAHGSLAPGHEQALAETTEYLTLCAAQAEAARSAFSN